MKQILLLAASLSAVTLPSLADENDALRRCIATQIATGAYRSADPQAPYRLLEACAALWQAARQRVMREKDINGQTADYYMAMTLHDSLQRQGY